ncbi:hypothetical protein FC40_GL001140 [Ligilactobacillus hayakitensis DSM 18933 = JCM 14209]|uniref:Uncharacterized protein n=2 Tax=Ligilactobacillus TaxID=2767887 RepID=A0A0R1WRG0_9LACO|nr:hypothetical protein [Ligilactobacillus hayakitensis]KRM17750.1 hypothetical protein FC40_GL001140 [Ligilactobacillus hayakitensis DSM 18933 = JCM 14209]
MTQKQEQLDIQVIEKQLEEKKSQIAAIDAKRDDLKGQQSATQLHLTRTQKKVEQAQHDLINAQAKEADLQKQAINEQATLDEFQEINREVNEAHAQFVASLQDINLRHSSVDAGVNAYQNAVKDVVFDQAKITEQTAKTAKISDDLAKAKEELMAANKKRDDAHVVLSDAQTSLKDIKEELDKANEEKFDLNEELNALTDKLELAKAKKKAEAEAKAAAEAAQKAKAAAEQKAKEAQAARLKAEAEAKAKEEEAKKQAEAEAKARQEEQARIEAEVQAAAKALEEAKAKAAAKEQEAKAARQKAEAEAKAKEEEAKKQAEAEAKARQEEQARIEAEVQAAQKAAAKALEEAQAKARAVEEMFQNDAASNEPAKAAAPAEKTEANEPKEAKKQEAAVESQDENQASTQTQEKAHLEPAKEVPAATPSIAEESTDDKIEGEKTEETPVQAVPEADTAADKAEVKPGQLPDDNEVAKEVQAQADEMARLAKEAQALANQQEQRIEQEKKSDKTTDTQLRGKQNGFSGIVVEVPEVMSRRHYFDDNQSQDSTEENVVTVEQNELQGMAEVAEVVDASEAESLTATTQHKTSLTPNAAVATIIYPSEEANEVTEATLSRKQSHAAQDRTRIYNDNDSLDANASSEAPATNALDSEKTVTFDDKSQANSKPKSVANVTVNQGVASSSVVRSKKKVTPKPKEVETSKKSTPEEAKKPGTFGKIMKTLGLDE